jgi:hypothetical protein
MQSQPDERKGAHIMTEREMIEYYGAMQTSMLYAELGRVREGLRRLKSPTATSGKALEKAMAPFWEMTARVDIICEAIAKKEGHITSRTDIQWPEMKETQ